MQVLGKTAKATYWLRIAVRRYSHKMLSAANIDSRPVPVYYFQTGIGRPDTTARFFFCFRVSRGPLFDSVFVSFAMFFLSSSSCWRGTARSRFTTYSLQRGQTASFEAVATNLMIDRTGARLYYGQDRANGTSGITCGAFAVLFLPQTEPAPQPVSRSHDAPSASRTLLKVTLPGALKTAVSEIGSIGWGRCAPLRSRLSMNVALGEATFIPLGGSRLAMGAPLRSRLGRALSVESGCEVATSSPRRRVGRRIRPR